MSKKRDLTKISLNVHSELLKQIDKFAEENHVTRTTAMTLLLTRQLIVLGYEKKVAE